MTDRSKILRLGDMQGEITRLQARVKTLEGAGTKMADCIEYGLLGWSDAVRQWDAALVANPVINAGCCQPVAWQYRYRAIGKEVGKWSDWNEGKAPDLRSSSYDVEERPLFAAIEPAPVTPAEAAKDVLAERQRQISAEGWTPEHDDAHIDGEMAQAAACYTLNAAGWKTEALRGCWPMAWASAWFKPTDPRRDLVKAGALIIAEIERLDRAALRAVGRGEA